jgi:hypothetical protein
MQREVHDRIPRAPRNPEEVKRLVDQLGLMVFKDLMRKNAGKLSFAGCDD